jgi:site-specific DNA-methyltransferase (adenine-specific)
LAQGDVLGRSSSLNYVSAMGDAEVSLPKPYYEEEGIVIYNADCRDILPHLPKVDLVLTDPPYPNGAGHFLDGIATADAVLRLPLAQRFMVFWHQLSLPPVQMPLVAHHIWHRTNTNRPDNYEPIYEFSDEQERHSRVFPHAVIYPGLTGCFEATGHPTQKPEDLMKELIELRKGVSTILDPFMGSGTTLRAAKDLGRRAIGIEIEEKYCEIAVKRLAQEVLPL